MGPLAGDVSLKFGCILQPNLFGYLHYDFHVLDFFFFSEIEVSMAYLVCLFFVKWTNSSLCLSFEVCCMSGLSSVVFRVCGVLDHIPVHIWNQIAS